MKPEKEWLDTLQLGDKVAYKWGSFSYYSYRIVTITKITPSRRFYTDDNRIFNNDGVERKKRSAWDRDITLEPVTQEILDRVETDELVSKLSQINFDKLAKEKKLSLNQLRKMVEVLESEE